MKPYFWLMKKIATPFHPCRFASNTLWQVNLQVQSFVTSKFRLRSNGRVEQISAHISGRAGGFVEAISLLAEKKNCLTVSLASSTCVFFLSESCLFLI